MNKKVKLRSADTKISPHYSEYFYIKLRYFLCLLFLPNLTSTGGEEEITITIYQSLPRMGILNSFQIKEQLLVTQNKK